MKPLAALLVLLSLSAVAGGYIGWRLLVAAETHTYPVGPPIEVRPGWAVCDGTVPVEFDTRRKTYRAAGCPPLVVFSGGFE